MSGLVERVKEKVRSRSKSRKSISEADRHHERPVTPNGHSNRPQRQDVSRDEALPRISKESSAFHVHGGSGRPVSGYSPTSPTSSSAEESTRGRGTTGIPDRHSSLHQRDAYRATSGQNPNTNRTSNEFIAGSPQRESFVNRKPLPVPKGDTTGMSNSGMNFSRPSRDDSLSSKIPGERTSRSLDLAPNDPSSLVPRYAQNSGRTNPTPDHDRSSNGHEGSGNQHLRLPPGFNMTTTEDTDVTETWRPAVTHETIITQRTEIIQEQITRDIHVHHYYTYMQPIKVVEVLPARHFAVDEKTGQKVEIEAPQGWEMPASMQPVKPDYSDVKGWERHYLVDEQHPNGIPELPPLAHERDRTAYSTDDRKVN